MYNLMEIAQTAQKNEKYSEAVEHYLQEISLNPTNVLAHQNAALCYYRIGKYKEALEACEKALSLDKNLAFVHLILAEIYDDQKEVSKSRDEMNIAYALDPESPDILGAYGAFLMMDRSINEAIPLLEKATKLNPNLYNVHNNLTVAYLQKKNFKKAYLHISQMYSMRPSMRNAIQLSIAYFNSKKLIKVFSILFIVSTTVSVILNSWVIMIVPAIYLTILIFAGIYITLTNARLRGR